MCGWRRLTWITLLAGAVACRSESKDVPKRPSLALSPSSPSSPSSAAGSATASNEYPGDIDVELVDASVEAWRSVPRPVLWDYVQGYNDRRTWFGVHVDADGTVCRGGHTSTLLRGW